MVPEAEPRLEPRSLAPRRRAPSRAVAIRAGCATAARPPAPEPAHVSSEPEPCAESADPGAEDGAGAEIRVDEPWPPYRKLRRVT